MSTPSRMLWQDGLMYNAYPASAVTSRGASRLGIEQMPPLVTRGVLVDTCPGDRRQVADVVHGDELERLVGEAGVELLPGDALLIRTGWLDAVRSGDADSRAWPGLDRDCATWLADQEVALVGADNAGVESFPSSDPTCQVPLHVDLLRGRGIYFLELLDLAELTAAARSTFLFVMAPLPLVGAVGSPVAPVVVL